jgi:hypothetical protein
MTRYLRGISVGLALLGAALIQPALAAPQVTAADQVWLDRWFAAARFGASTPPGVLLLPPERSQGVVYLQWGWGGAWFALPEPGSYGIYTDRGIVLASGPGPTLDMRAGDTLILVAEATAHPNSRAIEAAREVSSIRVTIDGVDVVDPRGNWAGPRPARFPRAFVHLAPYLPAGSVPSGAPTVWWPDAFVLPSGGLSNAPADVYLGGVALRIEGLEMGEHEIAWQSQLSWDRVLPAGRGVPVVEKHQLRVRLIP